MSLTSWSTRAAGEPISRTEERAAGVGPTDELRTENGKPLSTADNGVSATKLAKWRVTYGNHN